MCAHALQQVQQGLLWLWPESGRGAFAEAATQPPELTPQMTDPAWAGAQGDFAFMENPASLQVMLVGFSGLVVRCLPACSHGQGLNGMRWGCGSRVHAWLRVCTPAFRWCCCVILRGQELVGSSCWVLGGTQPVSCY